MIGSLPACDHPRPSRLANPITMVLALGKHKILLEPQYIGLTRFRLPRRQITLSRAGKVCTHGGRTKKGSQL